MGSKDKFQDDLLDTVESLCRLSNTLILLRKENVSPDFKQDAGSVSEHIAEVNVQLNRIVEEMGISEDVGWWYTKKRKRLENE